MLKFATEVYQCLIISFSLHDLLLNLSLFLYSVSFLLLVLTILAFHFMTKPRTIYLLDFACFKPPSMCRVPYATTFEHGRIILASQPKSYEFQVKIFERAGLGEETSLPQALHYIPPDPNLRDARQETEMVIFATIDSLFKQTGLTLKTSIS